MKYNLWFSNTISQPLATVVDINCQKKDYPNKSFLDIIIKTKKFISQTLIPVINYIIKPQLLKGNFTTLSPPQIQKKVSVYPRVSSYLLAINFSHEILIT